MGSHYEKDIFCQLEALMTRVDSMSLQMAEAQKQFQ